MDKIVVLFNLIVIFIVLMSLSGCYYTSNANRNIGIKYEKATNSKNFYMSKDAIYYTSDAIVSFNQKKFTKSDTDLFVTCSLPNNGSNVNTLEITDQKLEFKYSQSMDLVKFLKEIKSSNKILQSSDLLCFSSNIADNHEKLKTNELLVIDGNNLSYEFIPETFIFKTSKYNQNFYIVKNNNSITFSRLQGPPTLKTETFIRPFRYLVFPITITIDIITFPLQLLARGLPPRQM